MQIPFVKFFSLFLRVHLELLLLLMKKLLPLMLDESTVGPMNNLGMKKVLFKLSVCILLLLSVSSLPIEPL